MSRLRWSARVHIRCVQASAHRAEAGNETAMLFKLSTASVGLKTIAVSKKVKNTIARYRAPQRAVGRDQVATRPWSASPGPRPELKWASMVGRSEEAKIGGIIPGGVELQGQVRRLLLAAP